MTTATDSGPALYPSQMNHHERAARTRELYRRALTTENPAVLRSLHEEIVVLHLGVADGLAARYGGRGLDAEDLRQVARLALVRVVPRFDPEYGKDFLAYAVPSILGSLRKHFRDTGWGVRPPRYLQEAQQAVRRASPELAQRLGRQPSVGELALECGLSEETVLEAVEAADCFSPSSLDHVVSADSEGTTLGQLLGAEDPEFDRCDARLILTPLIARLAPRDRMVLELRFIEGLTQREIGERFGVSQMQISRIQTRILNTLRDQIGEFVDPPLAQAS